MSIRGKDFYNFIRENEFGADREIHSKEGYSFLQRLDGVYIEVEWHNHTSFPMIKKYFSPEEALENIWSYVIKNETKHHRARHNKSVKRTAKTG